MADGVAPIGQAEEPCQHWTTRMLVSVLKRPVLMLLIVLAATMTGLAPDQVVAVLALI